MVPADPPGSDETARYYAARASEYDTDHDVPAWRDDLDRLRERVVTLARGRRVLEVACGTGRWLEVMAPHATSVVGYDLNEETLAIARARSYPRGNVELRPGDAYAPLAGVRGDAGLAVGWLSHVDRARMGEFLDAFHAGLEPGSPVLMFDERARPERLLPTSRRDAAGNRHEWRALRDGTRFEIVKNLYDSAALPALVAGRAVDVAAEGLQYFWVLSYRTA